MQNVQFKIIFRGWIKNKTYTLISLISLITGITCCTLLVTFVIHEYNIAHSILNSKNCYLVQEQRKQDVHPNDAFISGESGVQLKNIYPEVKAYCVFRNEHLLFSEKAEEPDYMDAYLLLPVLQTFLNFPFYREIYAKHSHLPMRLPLPGLLPANNSESLTRSGNLSR